MSAFPDAYRDAEDRTERYRLLRAEMTRLRAVAIEDGDGVEGDDYYDAEAVAATLADLAGRIDGDLVVFAANDFGLPLAFRPEGTPRERANRVREALLDGKYDEQDDLDAIREDLLDAHPRVHKAIVAAVDDGVRYHLPEGSDPETAFLTVREMVGLVDWTTNSIQAEGLSRTY